MSLGGIAIAIGAMIDAAIVMIENMHKHLERAVDAKPTLRVSGDARRVLHTSMLTTAERWQIVVESAKEVGPALFFSLLIITVRSCRSSRSKAGGRLFKPLAFTKTFAMAAASLLSYAGAGHHGDVHPGPHAPGAANPINRALIRVYRPVIDCVLRHRWGRHRRGTRRLVLTWIPWSASAASSCRRSTRARSSTCPRPCRG